MSHVGGVPHPRSGGGPCPRSGGTLSQVGGTPSHVGGRREGDTPSKVWGVYLIPGPGGYLIPGLGVPHPDLVGGYPGYPPFRPPDLGWGTPLPRPGMGYPLARPGMGTPPARPGMGYPPSQTWDGGCPLDLTGVPPQDVNWQTNWKQYLPHPLDAGGKKSTVTISTCKDLQLLIVTVDFFHLPLTFFCRCCQLQVTFCYSLCCSSATFCTMYHNTDNLGVGNWNQ